jgi:hypothetical protein
MRDNNSIPSWQSDGAGALARIGVLTPHFDPVPESELWAMAPPGVSIHASRVLYTTTRDRLPSLPMWTRPRSCSRVWHRT